MEDKRCLVLVDGKECGLPLSRIDREAEKIARYDSSRHINAAWAIRSYFLQEPNWHAGILRNPRPGNPRPGGGKGGSYRRGKKEVIAVLANICIGIERPLRNTANRT